MRTTIPHLTAALLFLAGCSGMQTVTVPVMRPAPLHIDNHLQSVAVIDRTAPENMLLGTVEALLTGTTPALERDAAQEAIDGLVARLRQSPCFEVIRTSERLKAPNYRGNWPDPLSWDEVAALCDTYGVDALLVLETFNSDFIVTDGTRSQDRRTRGRTGSGDEREYTVEGVASLKIGFRVYDPTNRSIADAHMFDRSATWTATGVTVRDAAAQLIDHRKAVLNTSRDAGAKLEASKSVP